MLLKSKNNRIKSINKISSAFISQIEKRKNEKFETVITRLLFNKLKKLDQDYL